MEEVRHRKGMETEGWEGEWGRVGVVGGGGGVGWRGWEGARGASDQAQYQHRLTTNVECDFVSSR